MGILHSDDLYTNDDTLAGILGDASDSWKKKIIADPETPAALLLAIARHSDNRSAAELTPVPAILTEEQLDTLACDDNTDSATLCDLYGDGKSVSHRRTGYIALHQNTPPHILRDIAADPYEVHHARVAENPATPIDVLAALAKASHDLARESVAGNQNTPADTVIELSRDRARSVRINIASRPELDSKSIARMAGDYSADVRIVVALRDDLPARIRNKMLRDRDPYVAAAAKRLPE